jgi:hypothetical protein
MAFRYNEMLRVVFGTATSGCEAWAIRSLPLAICDPPESPRSKTADGLADGDG